MNNYSKMYGPVRSLSWMFFALLLLLTVKASAQFTSLSDAEVRELGKKVVTDAEAAKFYARYKQQAQTALGEQPAPIEKITSQGLLVGDPNKTASLKAVEDVDKMYALALVYRLGNEKKYLDKTIRFLLAWAHVNKATGDPIDETKLENAFLAYDLIRKEVTAADRKTIDQWFSSIADAEINSLSATGTRSTAKNNWNSHRIKIITQIACTLHDSKYNEIIVKELKKQLAQNLNPDGTSYDFHERDAFHYHIYTLEPLLKAMIALQRTTGANYFAYVSESGSSVKHSVDFLVPYVTGEKTHIEFANSTVAFDKKRADNNEKGYQPANFIPSHGNVVLSLAAYFDPEYNTIIDKLPEANKNHSDWQLVLNSVMKKMK